MRGARIHVCSHKPCHSLAPASKYGQFPPPIHGTFLQVHSPTDLSSLEPAPAAPPTMEAAPPIAEQPPSSMEHAPTVCPPAGSNAVSVELIVPSTMEPVPTVVGPPLPSEQAVLVGAPPLTSGAECPDDPVGVEHSQPADSQIGGSHVSIEEEPNACGEKSPDATPCADDDPHPADSSNDEFGQDEPMLPPPVSPISEIIHLIDAMDAKESQCAHGGGPGHELLEPAEVAEPDEIGKPDEIAELDVATLPEAAHPKAAEIAKPEVAALKGSAEFSADAVAPASVPLVTGTAPAPPAHPIPSEPRICQVLLQVLKLAEELRKPSAYCGHYVFALFCLCYGVRMNIWSGDECVDVVDEYIPWAAERCQAKSYINAIFCAFSVHPDTGVASIRPATSDVSVMDLNHFVATIGLQTSLVTGAVCSSSLESFYLPKGQCPLPTVADGNCTLDICVQSRGLPQTPDNFQAMRDRLAECLLANASNAALMSTLRTLGEITAAYSDATAEPMVMGPPPPTAAPMVMGPPTPTAAPMVMGPNDIVDPAPTAAAGATANVASREYSQIELDAIRWACGFGDQASDVRAAQSLITDLPDWTVQLQVVAYQARSQQLVGKDKHPPTSGGVPGAGVKRPYSATRIENRIDEGNRMLAFLKTKGLDPLTRWPRNIVQEYLNQSDRTRDVVTSRSRTYPRNVVLQRLRMFYLRAVKAVLAIEKTGVKVDTKRKCIRGRGSFRQRFRQRYRSTHNQGRCRKAPEVREALFEWWTSIRFSLQGKVMTRVTRKIITCKAQQLARDYRVLCLKKGVRSDCPRIDSHWVTDWADEYNVSFRKPNRAFKVPDHVLTERLGIFWENTFRLRRAAQLCLGYDLAMDNVDQSPFHKNEAGSKDVCSLSLRGAPTVPLIEGHAATRSRWSANTTTQSDYEEPDYGHEPDCPPLECQFKADGHHLEAKLNQYIRGYGFKWLSVSTSPKATYREEHIIAFLRRHFQPGPDARWRLMGLDMYGPQTTPNVFNCCWHQMQVLLNQPGGGTGITQTNDTDLHQGTKADYIHEETELMIHLVRATGKRCPTYNAEQCIEVFSKIWLDWRRHKEAAKGYWRTGTMNALDGSEDQLIVREAKQYWDRLDMGTRRKQVIHDIEVEHAAGRLSWTPSHIKALIVPYPKTGHMDVIREFQDDDYPPLEDGQEDIDSVAQEGESDDDSNKSDVDEEAFNKAVEIADEAAKSSLGEGTTAHLTYDQAKAASEIHDKLVTYERAREMMEDIGDRSSALALARTIHAEKRKARGGFDRDPAIGQALNAKLIDEAQEYARKRIEYNKERLAMEDAKKAKAEAQDLKRQTAATRAKLKEAKSLLECITVLKRFSPNMLGDGLSYGGPAKCRDLRFEVLDRLLAQGDPLSPQQKNDWAWFKREWDAAMAKEHNKTWGSAFAGMVQNLVNKLENGEASAVADFMYNETVRVLSAVPTLVL